MSNDPLDCNECGHKFENDFLLQQEVRYEIAKFGEAAGKRLARERLESYHEEGHEYESTIF